METIGKDYIIHALIQSKKHFLGESFVTTSELSLFEFYLQQELISRGMDITISFDLQNRENFVVAREIITETEASKIDLGEIPFGLVVILYNTKFVVDFWESLAQKRIEVLKAKREVTPRLFLKEKV